MHLWEAASPCFQLLPSSVLPGSWLLLPCVEAQCCQSADWQHFAFEKQHLPAPAEFLPVHLTSNLGMKNRLAQHPLKDCSVDCTTFSLESRHLSKTDNGKLRVQASNSEVLSEDSQTDYCLSKHPPWVLKVKIHEQMVKFLKPFILLRYLHSEKSTFVHQFI